jgi:hypothetical protein
LRKDGGTGTLTERGENEKKRQRMKNSKQKDNETGKGETGGLSGEFRGFSCGCTKRRINCGLIDYYY